jgi:sugar phosphate isomerase/epimerase
MSGTKRSQFGVGFHSFPFRKFADSIAYLEYCHSLGAAGVQCPLTTVEPEFARKLRARADELKMYLELQTSMPRGPDMAQFAAFLRAAREAGVPAVRVVNPGPRRYEAFKTLDDWKRAAAEAEATLARVAPLAESMKVPLAVENHRDWRLDEFVRRMEKHSSEYLGCCLDFGNNLALLDEPMAVIEQLSKWAITTHVKDIGVEKTAEGFGMAEVPPGQGIVDVKAGVDAVRKVRPKVNLLVEMITRDPTPIPCLTQAYWTTMPGVPASEMARVLALVEPKTAKLPRVSTLSKDEQLRVETDNIRRYLEWA